MEHRFLCVSLGELGTGMQNQICKCFARAWRQPIENTVPALLLLFVVLLQHLEPLLQRCMLQPQYAQLLVSKPPLADPVDIVDRQVFDILRHEAISVALENLEVTTASILLPLPGLDCVVLSPPLLPLGLHPLPVHFIKLPPAHAVGADHKTLHMANHRKLLARAARHQLHTPTPTHKFHLNTLVTTLRSPFK